jgi:hypothetical protein
VRVRIRYRDRNRCRYLPYLERAGQAEPRPWKEAPAQKIQRRGGQFGLPMPGPQRGQKKKPGKLIRAEVKMEVQGWSVWHSCVSGVFRHGGHLVSCSRRGLSFVHGHARGSGMGCTGWHKCWPWRHHARLPGDEVFDLTSSERHLFAASRQLRPSTVGDRVHN